ncbi:MAG TPA: DUF3108 domain-containing protein [Thermoanaerobaculia bacterium]|nr:DUF3108 domain-containing protein [Thermoanaerobaculia bacterium]
MKRSTKMLPALFLAILLFPSLGGSVEGPPANEEFRYRWQLRNFMGAVAGLFLPRQGEGSLTFKRTNGHLKSELTITSPQSKQEGYFRYGSEVDVLTLQPIRAWSAYSWRGESKSKNEAVDEEGVLDVAAGIYAIRNDPPTKSRRMQIWSDGKIYPVVVIPLGIETRQLPHGKVKARHYSIRGVNVPGERKWKGKLDLWLATDEAATPVEILISRNMADVRMELMSRP